MSASRWIELVGVDQTTEAVCTLGEFLAANAEAFGEDEIAGLRAMDPEDGWYAFGGGAAPSQWVRILSTKRAAMLDEIAAACEAQPVRTVAPRPQPCGIEVQVDYSDDVPMPFSIWTDEDIIGAGLTLDACLADALATVRGWHRGPSEHDSSVRVLPSGEVSL